MRFQETIGTLTLSSTTQVALVGRSVVKLGGLFKILNSPSLSISTTGIGGLDTGAVAASTLYYVYAVSNGTSDGIVASLSNQSPTGFTRYKKVGAFVTDGSSVVGKVYFSGEIANPKRYKITFSGSYNPPGNSTYLVTGHSVLTVDSPLLTPSNSANPGLRYPAGYYGKRTFKVYGYGNSDTGSASGIAIGLTNTPQQGSTDATVWNRQASSSSGERGGINNTLSLSEGSYADFEQLMYVAVASSPNPANNLAVIQRIECDEVFTFQPDWKDY